MKALLVLLAVAVAIAGGAETAAPGPEETTTTASPATLSPETSGANPAADDSEPNAEPQRALDFWDRDNKPEACLNFKCKTAPRECIERDQKCDGRKHCRDGSDEDPIACEVSTTSLEPGEFMSFKANLSWQHDAIEVYSCTSQRCNGLVPLELMFVNKKPDKQLEFFKQTGCNAKGQQCTFKEKRRKPTWNLKEEYTYVVENRIDHLTLKRLDYPDKIGTVEIPLRTNNVVIRPSNFPYYENSKSYTVTFGERKRLPGFMSSLMNELISKIENKASPDDMDRLTSLAEIAVRNEHDKRAIRWMQLAAATVPKASKNSSFVLATNVVEFLTGALEEVSQTKALQDNFNSDNLHTKAVRFSTELGLRLEATKDLVDTQLLPQINNVALALQNQTAQVKERKAKSETEIAEKNKELDKLNGQLNGWKIASIVGKVLGVVAGAVSAIPGGQLAGAVIGIGATVVSETTSGMMEKIKDEISAVKAKIAKEKEISASMERLIGLLNSSADMIVELEKVKSDSLTVRAWLTGRSMIKFRSQLVFLTFEDLGAATAGRVVVDILVSAGRSLVDGLDKLEWYQSQRTIVDLTTTPLSTGDSEETRVGLSNLRKLVKQQVVLADYRTTMRSLEQYALPFCSLLVTSQTERCHENQKLDDLVTCSKSVYEDVLNKLKMEKGSLGRDTREFGYFYRRSNDDDRSFVTWKNAEYASAIADLLAGRQIALKADVFAAQSNTHVLKFNDIYLQFWIADEKAMKDLKSALRFFKVVLKHSGDSHYKCGADVLGITHRPVNIMYSIKKNPREKPLEASDDYYLMRQGDKLLSPYATWIVQLLPFTKAKADYATLQRFASQVDLSLSGLGSYVSESVTCDGCVWDYKVIQPSGQAAAPTKPRIYIPLKEKPPLDPEDVEAEPESSEPQ